jgi:hypothetical protein
VRIVWGRHINCVGKVQSFLMLNLVAHVIIMTEPERGKVSEVCRFTHNACEVTLRPKLCGINTVCTNIKWSD